MAENSVSCWIKEFKADLEALKEAQAAFEEAERFYYCAHPSAGSSCSDSDDSSSGSDSDSSSGSDGIPDFPIDDPADFDEALREWVTNGRG